MLKKQFDGLRLWLGQQLPVPRALDQSRRRNIAIGCGIVFLIALTIRLVYLQDASAEIARGDSTIQALANPYRDEARRMLDTGGVLYPQSNVDRGDARVIVHPPGYAVLIAAATVLFDEADAPVRLAQILLAAGQAAFVVLISVELLPVGLATIAGLLAAFSPHLAYYSIFLSPDSMCAAPILIAVYLVIRASKQPRLNAIVAGGALVGLSCWLRSNALFLSLFLSVAVLFLFQRGRLRYAISLAAATLLVIAPITLRNWIVYGRFIPLSIGAGLNLMQGIAEYDQLHRFELPILDADVMSDEVSRYGRPDYGQSLYVPDGIDRDQARLERGLSVVRSNPGWFAGVILRRMVFMLRYNDFRLENPSFNSPIAPAVSVHPNFGHALTVPEGVSPVWSESLTGAAERAVVAPQAVVSVEERGQALQIIGDGSDLGDQFTTAPITVKKGTDYILALQIKRAWGALSAKVRTSDPRIILAASRIPQRKGKGRPIEGATAETQAGEPVYLFFATGEAEEVRVVIANDKVAANDRAASDRPVVLLGSAEVFLAGPTPGQWTRGPRSVIRGVQKNLYKTEWMWVLIVIGAGSLTLARRGRVLLMLLTVPAYYLSVQSALHTESRYVLAIHYFLFICAAATLYVGWMSVRRIVTRGMSSSAKT